MLLCSESNYNQFYLINLWKSFSLTHYTFQTHFGTSNFTVTWKVEGSNENITWTNLHPKEADGMISKGNYSTFKCSFLGSHKHIKFTQTSKASNEGHVFGIGRLEIFGSFGNSSIFRGSITKMYHLFSPYTHSLFVSLIFCTSICY